MFFKKITDADFTGSSAVYLTSVSRYGARGILLDGNKIAMMHMKKNNCYKLPGGGIERGETKEQAFCREIREETGFHCEILQEIGQVEEHKLKNKFLQRSYCFIAKKTKGAQQQALSDNEIFLGFHLTWMTYPQALEAMEASLAICNQYTMKFMLLRDQYILQQSGKLLEKIIS